MSIDSPSSHPASHLLHGHGRSGGTGPSSAGRWCSSTRLSVGSPATGVDRSRFVGQRV